MAIRNADCINGQISLFDDSFSKMHEEKPWYRLCRGKENECFDAPEDGICKSLWKCSRRKEYQSLNSYYLEKMDGRRTLLTPLGGCTILCDENKEQADELIRRTMIYFGWSEDGED